MRYSDGLEGAFDPDADLGTPCWSAVLCTLLSDANDDVRTWYIRWEFVPNCEIV